MDAVGKKKSDVGIERHSENIAFGLAIAGGEHVRIQPIRDNGTREPRKQRTTLPFSLQPAARSHNVELVCRNPCKTFLLALPNPVGPIRSSVGAELRASSALLGKSRAAMVPMTTSREGSHVMKSPNDRSPRREGHEEGC